MTEIKEGEMEVKLYSKMFLHIIYVSFASVGSFSIVNLFCLLQAITAGLSKKNREK